MKNEFDALIAYLLNSKISMQEGTELLERKMIAGALAANDGKQLAAAKQLGIHRNTLLRKMRDYELENGRSHRRKPVTREAPTRKRKSA